MRLLLICFVCFAALLGLGCEAKNYSNGLKYIKLNDFITAIQIEDESCHDFLQMEMMRFFDEAKVLSQTCANAKGNLVAKFYSTESGKIMDSFAFPDAIYNQKTGKTSWDMIFADNIMFGRNEKIKFGFFYKDQYVKEYRNGTLDFVFDGKHFQNSTLKYGIDSFPDGKIFGNCFVVSYGGDKNLSDFYYLYDDKFDDHGLPLTNFKQIKTGNDGLYDCKFLGYDKSKKMEFVTSSNSWNATKKSEIDKSFSKIKVENTNNNSIKTSVINTLKMNGLTNRFGGMNHSEIKIVDGKVIYIDDNLILHEWQIENEELNRLPIIDNKDTKLKYFPIAIDDSGGFDFIIFNKDNRCNDYQCTDVEEIKSQLYLVKCKDNCKLHSVTTLPLLNLEYNNKISYNSERLIYLFANMYMENKTQEIRSLLILDLKEK